MADLITDQKVWKTAMGHIGRDDKVMQSMMKSLPQRRMTLHKNHFEALVKAIIFQQISGSAGDSIFKRFRGLYGGRTPTPEMFLATKEEKVRSAGISPQKYGYLRDLAERIEDGRLELSKFYKMPDVDVVRELDEVKGIGRWTAEMFLIFTLGRANVLPVDDLGLRKALARSYRLRKLPTEKRFREIARKWQPYCTVASLYLWSSLDNEKTGQNW